MRGSHADARCQPVIIKPKIFLKLKFYSALGHIRINLQKEAVMELDQSSDNIEVFVGMIPGRKNRGMIPRGTRVVDAFAKLGVPLGDPESWELKRSVSLHDRINEDCTITATRPIRGNVEIAQRGTSFNAFGQSSMRDLRYNLKYGYPIFVVLAIWLFVSAWILHKLEPRSNYWETIWVTWTTMTTMGWGSFSLQTVLGKLMISADALAGLILIGTVVWLVTTSLPRQ
jgi:hypothetical protein